jgi:hypothetical protein
MSDDQQRSAIARQLAAGLDTEVEPRAYNHEQAQAVVTRLASLAPGDIAGRLRIAGFTLTPYGEGEDEQACETCMYYQVHRRFCELPELMLAVEPRWSCRLWRI